MAGKNKKRRGWRDYGPKDFLHRRKGPWPQPSPHHPMGEAPSVVHIPLSESVDFNLRVGLRYLRQLMLSAPKAYFQMFFRPGLKEVSDEEFERLYTDTILSKHMSDALDETDREHFSDVIDAECSYFIVDFEPVQSIQTYEGIYASGSKALFEQRGEYVYKIVAIYIFGTDTVFTPDEGDAWLLAKYYSLQGAALVTTLLKHPLLHFPFDLVNAITKTAVPKDHVLFRLLSPHWRFTLPLEGSGCATDHAASFATG